MTTTIKEEEMHDRSTRSKLLGRAHDYVDAHEQEFDPADAGMFWGDALCDVLGGADYLEFGQVKTDAGEVICVLPVFGEPVHERQFTAERLRMVIAAADEIRDAAPKSPKGVIPDPRTGFSAPPSRPPPRCRATVVSTGVGRPSRAPC